MVLHINELARSEGRSGFKRGLAGGGRLWREPRAERTAQRAATVPKLPPTGAAGVSGAGRRAPGRKSRAPRTDARAPSPKTCSRRALGQHETPDRRAAPAAPGAVRRARGR